MKKIFVLVSVVLMLTILLTGCTSQSQTPGSPTTAGPTEVLTAVPTTTTVSPVTSSFPTGVTWRLFSFSDGKGGMANVIGDQPVTALFRADGTVTGSSGCNQYTAGYTTIGSSIKITKGISTTMACTPVIMGQESSYYSLMPNATTYSVQGDTLLFFDSSGTPILGYKKPQNTPVILSTQAPVVGSWDLLTYNNGNNALVSVRSGSNITAVFTPDGTITGSSGCNEYSAVYSLTRETFGISKVKSTTTNVCDPDTISQENQYLALLARVNTYTTSGDQMVLSTALGEKVLIYKKEPTGTVTPAPTSTSSSSQRTLVGTWALKSYTGGKGGAVPVLDTAPITAGFLADGSLSGSSGCNQYSTTYSVSGQSISISPAATTRMSCDPETMAQEAAYLALLTKAGKVGTLGDTMTLYDSSGNVLLSYAAV